MAAIERAVIRGERRAERARRELADEFRSARIAAGWTQQRIAAAVGMSRSHYLAIEAGRVRNLTIGEAGRIAASLGLDLVVRAYPGAGPIRDAAHAARLQRAIGMAAPPLRVRLEVPLARTPGLPELRAWDAVVGSPGRRTAVELEMRLRDLQALERRLALKRRDDPVDGFVLLVANSHANRRALAGNRGFFADLPRCGPARLRRALEAGEHPPSCLVVV
ncbi:MAG TPA: helix-turn-helix transcriptional regulator [Candidatus Limnocylindrales bacterium]|nr:helix-turn-helix transcriptional regulator [Candidatus Limnocylindrales bacterium]